jgi:hypothetical protein
MTFLACTLEVIVSSVVLSIKVKSLSLLVRELPSRTRPLYSKISAQKHSIIIMKKCR